LNITEITATLVLQIGVILFAVRLGATLARKIGIPPVLGELIAGIAIGPHALGGISLPAFPHGLFVPEAAAGGIAVSPELYTFSTVGSIILLFASGLETDLALFLRYSVAGGVIGIFGVVCSFVTGDLALSLFLGVPVSDPRCLFFGVLSTATSVGITARILSDRKKMDTPEGVTTLASAVFDDVLGIIVLAIVMGIAAAFQADGGNLDAREILGIAGRAFGIWLGFTAVGLVCANKIAGFLKVFKSPYDFSILALGIALLVSGVFEKHGLAMIIGAYVTGLSLSKTDIAALIQERLRGLYEFFVPVFFAVMGMMVNVREMLSPTVLVFGGIYTLTAIVSKIAGCGGSALLVGFNWKGALRIGVGMVPRGEVALIIAGIGLGSGVLNEQFFSVIILMTLVTTLVAPPLLNLTLNMKGTGARRAPDSEDSISSSWAFESAEIAGLVVNTLLKDLKDEGFYVQMMNMDEGISQARKDDMALSINITENVVTIASSKDSMPYIKTAMYEVIIELLRGIQELADTADTGTMRKEIAEMSGGVDFDILSLLDPKCVSLNLRGTTKEAIIAELVQLLAFKGKINDYETVLQSVLQREQIVSTGMEHGVAIPHAKTDGARETVAAIGIQRAGVDFQSVDGEKSRIFILIISPSKHHNHHLRFLSSISGLLHDETLRENLLSAGDAETIVSLLRARGPR
jgi:fructose-specific phosphotransferase system IIA component